MFFFQLILITGMLFFKHIVYLSTWQHGKGSATNYHLCDCLFLVMWLQVAACPFMPSGLILDWLLA